MCHCLPLMLLNTCTYIRTICDFFHFYRILTCRVFSHIRTLLLFLNSLCSASIHQSLDNIALINFTHFQWGCILKIVERATNDDEGDKKIKSRIRLFSMNDAQRCWIIHQLDLIAIAVKWKGWEIKRNSKGYHDDQRPKEFDI